MSDLSAQAVPEGKKLRVFDMVLFSVCAMLLLSQVTVSAKVGPSAIFWTVLLIIAFFVPYGLVTAEMGSTYPDAGGIYSWITRAFGSRWGTRVSWWYWLNVGLWVPSVYLMLSGAVSAMFFHNNLNFWVQIAIALALIWLNFYVNWRSLETGAWVSNAGAVITVAVIVVLGVVGGVHASQHGSATAFTLHSMLPSGGMSAAALAIPVIMYNFLGFELMSSASKNMENPSRDVPRTIMIAGALIGGFYLLSTVGMLQILPMDQISDTTGLVDALKAGMGNSTLANVVVIILGLGALFCFFACLIPWTIGANLAAAESSDAGDLPRAFGKLHPTRGTPVGAALMTAIVGTVFTLGYGIASALTSGAVDDLFWKLFAFSSVIFLLPYLLLMPAFRKLRIVDPDRPRPYRVPGGAAARELTTWVPVVFLALAAVFFIIDPFDVDWTSTLSILAGLAITFVIQEYFVHKSPQWKITRGLPAFTTFDQDEQ